MIIDNIVNAHQYDNLHPLFAKAFDYLESLDFGNLELGKKELEGEDLMVITSDSTMKAIDAGKLEVHNQYIDIQIPLSKIETFGWSPRQACQEPESDFNEEKDCQLFKDSPEMYFDLKPSEFAIFFPGDAHAPCLGEDTIRKMIFKVKVQ